MLWYKGWLETRFRVLFMLLFAVFPVALALSGGHHLATTQHAPTPVELAEAQRSTGFLAMYYSIIPLFLAGSGTNYAKKPGSTYFTLSLPISRLRLLATGAGSGMLATVGIFAVVSCTVWFGLGDDPGAVSLSNLFTYWAALSVGTSGFYFLGVLLSTFLDDRVRGWISMFGVVFLRWFLSTVPVPAPLNVFDAMTSPLYPPFSFPWASMGISLGVAAVLGWAALRVMETREY